MREIGALLFDRAVAEKSRPIAERRRLENAAATLRDPDVDDEAALEIVRDPAIAAFFAARPLTSLDDRRRRRTSCSSSASEPASAPGTSSSPAPRARAG